MITEIIIELSYGRISLLFQSITNQLFAEAEGLGQLIDRQITIFCSTCIAYCMTQIICGLEN